MPSTSPTLYLVRSGPLMRFGCMWRQGWVGAYEDNCFGVAKGAAYSSLLAFFPVLASMTAVLAQVKADAVAGVFSRLLFEVVPPGSEDLVRYQFTIRGQRPGWLILAATILSAWAASGAIMSLLEGFQAAYRLPSGRPFVKQPALPLLLVVSAALPAIGSSALILFGARSERTVLAWTGMFAGEELKTWAVLLGSFLRYAMALPATLLIPTLLYFVCPIPHV